MARIVDLNVTGYWWIPGAAGITTPDSPKLSDASAAGVKNISQFVVTTTNINPTASDTVNEKGITDSSNAVVPTIGNYEGNLVLFRDYAAGIATANDVMSLFTGAREVGWILRRLGKPASVALGVADVVDVFLFMADSPQQSGGAGDGYLKLTVPLLQQGTFRLGKTMVA
jgi:hypothetical protein